MCRKMIYALCPESFCAWNYADRKVLTFCVSGSEFGQDVSFLTGHTLNGFSPFQLYIFKTIYLQSLLNINRYATKKTISQVSWRIEKLLNRLWICPIFESLTMSFSGLNPRLCTRPNPQFPRQIEVSRLRRHTLSESLKLETAFLMWPTTCLGSSNLAYYIRECLIWLSWPQMHPSWNT